MCVYVCLHILNIMNSKDSERQTMSSRVETNITFKGEELGTVYLRVTA